MTSGSFGAEPRALSAAAQAFDAQSDPIAQQAQRLEGIKGSAATTGKAYAAQGAAYHDAVTTTLNTVVRTFSEKTAWLSGALSQTASDYASGDESGRQQLTGGGQGLT